MTRAQAALAVLNRTTVAVILKDATVPPLKTNVRQATVLLFHWI